MKLRTIRHCIKVFSFLAIYYALTLAEHISTQINLGFGGLENDIDIK
jgi:hypothetical protein